LAAAVGRPRNGKAPSRARCLPIDGEYANPVIVVDEIDKASCHAQYDFGAVFTGSTIAGSLTDEFVET
jgi:ATP-dependent Lon protease